VNGNIIEIRNLSKVYPGVTALKNISLGIKKNSVHCIVGENGAGKTTLIKILTGATQKSTGSITYNNINYEPRNPKDALKSGISTIFQELNIVEKLTIEDNLTLGKEKRRLGFIIKRYDENAKVFSILKQLEPSLQFKKRVSEISIAHRQIVEIAKAIASDAKLIIMDEPTSALSTNEVKRLFEIINNLKRQDITILYISHKLEEIFEIGSLVTVLRDGKVIGTKKVSEVSSKIELVKMMIGKTVAEQYIPSKIDHKTSMLKVKNLKTDKLKDISFELHKGEILGFYGLLGSGKTEIARALFGLDVIKKGEITIKGQTFQNLKGPKKVLGIGVSMVPEERRTQGLFGELTIKENIPIMNISKCATFGIVKSKKEREITNYYVKNLRIVATSIEQKISTLSGGNQQKVVVAKCLNADSDVLLMDEPTRGIDVGAKEEIHHLIRTLSHKGKAIIVFSSELPEIINLCDRIILLFDGGIGEIINNGKNINSEHIMHVVSGGMMNGN
jgi:ABC-type sugar transport system ATPase subunit